MPKALEDCVKALLEDGYTKSQAYAICNKSINDKSNDSKPPMNYEICQDSGFLHADGISARSGIQEYYGYELGLSGDDGSKIFNVYRPKEEVEKSLETFNGAVITNEHPLSGIVTTQDNSLVKGNVSNATGFIGDDGEYYISNKAIITDQKLINDIKNGKRELSAGYSRDLIAESGTHKGVPYQFVQRNIKCNHVAVVDECRCGNACKLNLDKKGDKRMVELQLDGKTVSMDAKEVTKHINELKTSLDEATTKVKEMEDEKVAMDQTAEELTKMIQVKTEELAKLNEQLAGMITIEEAEEMAEENNTISQDAEELGVELKEKSNDSKKKEILNVIVGKDHNFDSMDKSTLATIYSITVDQAKKAKKMQVDGYKGKSDEKQVFQRTGNLSNDLNTVAAAARKQRKDK